MVEDASGPYTLRTRASIHVGGARHLHVTVKRKKARTDDEETPR